MFTSRIVAIYLTAILALGTVAIPVSADHCLEGELHDDAGACVAQSPPAADIGVDLLGTDPVDPVDGEEMSLWADVANRGDGDATVDVVFHLDGVELQRVGGHLVPAGSTTTLDYAWVASIGPHELRVAIEDAPEGDDPADNEKAMTFDVAERPEEPTVTGQWTECHDGREYEITEYDDGSRKEVDIGACGEPADGTQHAWVVDSWCDGADRIDAWTDDSGAEWTERSYNASCEDDHHRDSHVDPYGCTDGTWWDHYLAACVTEEMWQLQDAFFRCTEQAHRDQAATQRQKDIEAREARLDQRAMERQAIELEYQGRWEEAEAIWRELDRLRWEEERRFHDMEIQLKAAIDACIEEFSQKARAMGAAFLVEEFEMHRFHAPPAPEAMPGGHDGFACPPPGDRAGEPWDPAMGGPGDHPYDPSDPYAYDEGPYDADPFRGHPGPGDPCGDGGFDHGPMGPMPADFGMSAEAMAAMEDVRAWCEERLWAVEEQMFAAESWEEAQSYGDEIRDIERQCQERMRKVFETHGPTFEEEFDHHFGNFQMQESAAGIKVYGAHTQFIGKPDDDRLEDFWCGDVQGPKSVQTYFTMEDAMPSDNVLGIFDQPIPYDQFDPRRGPPAFTDLGVKPVIRVVDDAHCTLNLNPGLVTQVSDGEIRVDFPSSYTCTKVDGQVACHHEDGAVYKVIHHGEEPTLRGGTSLIITDSADIRLVAGRDGLEISEEKRAWLESKDSGGSVAVAKRDGKLVAQAVALADLEMTVKAGEDEESLEVTLDSAAGKGKTITMDIAPGLFDSGIRLEAFDVDAGGDELDVCKADSIADVLAPSEEDDCTVEYREVMDADSGERTLLVSIAHFSTKKLVLHESGSGNGLSLPTPGVSATLIVAMLGTALVVRSRRD